MKPQTNLKQTPLFAEHEKRGGKIIDFGGWALPVQFTGILAEHQAVREQAGLFDVSHMGEIMIEGTDAEAFVNRLITNDVSRLSVNQALYTVMCDEQGGTIDDLLVYKLDASMFMLVVNGANIEKDVNWINGQAAGEVTVTDVSGETALFAVQGPKAEAVLQPLTSIDLSVIRPFHFQQHAMVSGAQEVLVSRTGYTGEDGFELYVPASAAPSLWQHLAEENLVLCGLGARDTLRLEACLPLYGQELTEAISPLEAGLNFTVKLDKKNSFIGQEALQKQKQEGVKRKLAGIEMIGKGIPRSGYRVFSEAGELIGAVTSGTHSPTLKKPIGLALLQSEFAAAGTAVWIEIRAKQVKAIVSPTPFYKKSR